MKFFVDKAIRQGLYKKTFLHRAYTVCLNREIFEVELKRNKQLLVKNNFPNKVFGKTFRKFLFRNYANRDINSSQQETNRTTKLIVNV